MFTSLSRLPKLMVQPAHSCAVRALGNRRIHSLESDLAELLPKLEKGDEVNVIEVSSGDSVCGYYFDAQSSLAVAPPKRAVLSGSFNPLHHGHETLLQSAVEHLEKAGRGKYTPCFELTVGNPDKGWLSGEECLRRCRQFSNSQVSLLLTAAPLFTDRANLLPGSCFIVGYDTAVRILDPKYYGGQDGLRSALDRLVARQCFFLVGGRLDASSGQFLTKSDLVVPQGFEQLFVSVPGFRVDISSTELRARADANK